MLICIQYRLLSKWRRVKISQKKRLPEFSSSFGDLAVSNHKFKLFVRVSQSPSEKVLDYQ